MLFMLAAAVAEFYVRLLRNMSTTSTILDAEAAIRCRFIEDGFHRTLEYAADKVIETDR